MQQTKNSSPPAAAAHEPGATLDRPREILVLCRIFPPGPRILKFLKHLPTYGWHPTVLCPHNPDDGDARYVKRAEAASYLPHVKLEETRFLKSPGDHLRALKKSKSRRGSAADGNSRGVPAAERVNTTASHQPAAPAPRTAAGGVRSRIAAAARWLLLWTNTPDSLVGWLPWAIRHGVRICRRQPIKAIFASGPPFSVVLAGALLKRATGLPFVADFRDAWVLDPTDPFGAIGGSFRAPYGKSRVAVLSALEKYVMKSADIVLFTSDYTMNEYRRAYPFLKDRGMILYNGVEETDFQAPLRRLDRFTFGYFGNLHDYQREQVLLFFRALALAGTQDERLREAAVHFAGGRSNGIDAAIRQVARESGIESNVRTDNTIPHSEVVSLSKGCGALLLFCGDARFMRLTKVSDCLAAGRPMLALAPEDSETARHVREAGDTVYSGHSVEELAAVLRQLFERHHNDSFEEKPFPFPHPNPLNWQTNAMELAARLDALTAGRRSR